MLKIKHQYQRIIKQGKVSFKKNSRGQTPVFSEKIQFIFVDHVMKIVLLWHLKRKNIITGL